MAAKKKKKTVKKRFKKKTTRKKGSRARKGSPEIVKGPIIAGGTGPVEQEQAREFPELEEDLQEEEFKSQEDSWEKSSEEPEEKPFQIKTKPIKSPEIKKDIFSARFIPEKAGKANIKDVQEVAKKVFQIKQEVGKAFFGHEDVVESLIRALLCNGHVLLEGVPGIAKTLVIKALAKISGCSSKRIQFTVDLLPTDITGLTTYDPNKGFEVVKGPIFSNFIIADEINRSPPKTQSALLEAMQEKQVSIGKETYKLPNPFFVMANQNPLETEGVYSLPEAQVDRFLFKVVFGYPKKEHEFRVMEQNITFKKFEDIDIKTITSPAEIIKMQHQTHKIYLDGKIKDHILKIVTATREKNFEHGQYIEMGGSPRASINLYIASKAEALLRGRYYVLPEDVDKVAYDVLRHRLILTYRAQAENITPEKIIDEILQLVRSS
ncbi:MAG: MoxR family ATPase [Nanoarchaeota archaeon]